MDNRRPFSCVVRFDFDVTRNDTSIWSGSPPLDEESKNEMINWTIGRISSENARYWKATRRKWTLDSQNLHECRCSRHRAYNLSGTQQMNNIFALSFLFGGIMEWRDGSMSTAEAAHKQWTAETNHLLSRHAGLFSLAPSFASKCARMNYGFGCLQHAISHVFLGVHKFLHLIVSCTRHSIFVYFFSFSCACKIPKFMWIFFVQTYTQVVGNLSDKFN